jgi:hypothetical protein
MNKAYLEITMKVPAKDRVMAGAVYSKYKDPFLTTIPGAENPRSSSYVKRMYRCFTDSIHEPQQKAT